MDNLFNFQIPLLGFAAFSGTGKTTLLEKLIPILVDEGIRVGLIKHSHHDIEMDTPGKDSYRLRKAGACQVVIAGTHRSILFNEHKNPHDSELEEQLALLQTQDLDLVIVEGYRDAALCKIELHRSSLNKPLLFKSDPAIIAFASDTEIENIPLPCFSINNPDEIALFIKKHLLAKNSRKHQSQ